VAVKAPLFGQKLARMGCVFLNVAVRLALIVRIPFSMAPAYTKNPSFDAECNIAIPRNSARFRAIDKSEPQALSSRALSSRALSSRALSSPRAHSQRLKVQITRPKYPANRERLRQILARVRLLLAVAFVK
jgi:hypothetical protein